MPHVPQAELEKMFAAIPDMRLRQHFTDSVTGAISKNVRCLSETCAGRVVGYIRSNGVFDTAIDATPESGLRSGRNRFDGATGFLCRCGNDSRRSRQELANLSLDGNMPSRDDLEAIYERLLGDPPDYPVINGRQEVDGFVIEDAT